MRRTGAVVLALVLLVGCAGTTPPTGQPPAADATGAAPLRVVATFTVLADIAQRVAGDGVEVVSVTRPGAEIHGYEPTPEDLRRADGADLLLVNGLGLEDWVRALVEPLGLREVVVTDGIDPVLVTGTDVVNPHAWMSPREGRQYVEAVVVALTDLDPAGEEGYRERGAALQAELADLEEELLRRLATVPPARRLLVTCEGAFSYLARDGGLEEAYLWPVNAERQGTPQQVAAVVDTVREREATAVFCESTVSHAAMEQVARESGARLAGTLHVDSLTGADGPVPTYVDLLRHTVEVITDGLTAQEPA